MRLSCFVIITLLLIGCSDAQLEENPNSIDTKIVDEITEEVTFTDSLKFNYLDYVPGTNTGSWNVADYAQLDFKGYPIFGCKDSAILSGAGKYVYYEKLDTHRNYALVFGHIGPVREYYLWQSNNGSNILGITQLNSKNPWYKTRFLSYEKAAIENTISKLKEFPWDQMEEIRVNMARRISREYDLSCGLWEFKIIYNLPKTGTAMEVEIFNEHAQYTGPLLRLDWDGKNFFVEKEYTSLVVQN